jgi:hypothetical protein
MRRWMVVTPAFVLIAACGSGPTAAEQNISERERGPEQVTGPDNIAAGTAPASEQGQLGDTMPANAAGPTRDQGTGAGGDSAPSQ